MKKLFLLLIAFIPCMSAVANDHFYVKYNNDEVVYYYANYNETVFHIYGFPLEQLQWLVYDTSWYDDSREKSRKDYDRIYNEIMQDHSDAIKTYEKCKEGQTIRFKHGYIKDIGK